MPGMATEMTRIGPTTSSALSVDDRRQEGSTHLSKEKILKMLGRWVWTAVFTILILAVAKIYLAKGNITKTQKSTYHLIQTALILALGLNLSVSDDTIFATRTDRSCDHSMRSRCL